MIKLIWTFLLLTQGLVSSEYLFDVDLVTFKCKLIDLVLGLFEPIITGYNNDQVSFLLFTRKNDGNNSEFSLEINDVNNLQNSKFDGTKKTIFIFHGFTDEARLDWVMDMKTKILSVEDANVICVDMKEPLKPPVYTCAVCNVYKIANYSAHFIKFLSESGGLEVSNVHLIGHSLGAHISGLTGFYVQELFPTLGKIGRITGLDPAGPSFYLLVNKKRLNKDQANFVDVIHTNGCDLAVVACLGLREVLGHVDFYPNGGLHQPGCFGLNGQVCSHQRAYELFTESIIPESPLYLNFTSWPCKNKLEFNLKKCTSCDPQCLNMGFHLNSTFEHAENKPYYLSINKQSPFAKGDQQK